MHELLNDAAARAIRYLDGLDARSVAPTPEAIAAWPRLSASPVSIMLHRVKSWMTHLQDPGRRVHNSSFLFHVN